MCQEKGVEEEAHMEEEVEEESLGRDADDGDDKGTSVLSDIPDYEGADIWGEVSAAIYLMLEGVTKFQAGSIQLKNVM